MVGMHLFLYRKGFVALLVAILLLLVVAEGAKLNSHTNKEIEEQLYRFNKPLKTIMSEDGDIIDCVDVYKQPAFSLPFLKNHTIQMWPSFIPKEAKSNKTMGVLAQTWQNNGSCPEGTIPIQRIQGTDFTMLNYSKDSKHYRLDGEFSNCKVEVARIEVQSGGPYIGAQASINVWSPHVEADEWSLNSVTVYNDIYSFVEAGWAVSPVLFGDHKPRLFANWLDTSKDIGCFNLRCAGFVQVSSRFVLGGTMPYVSAYEGEQYDLPSLVIYKDALQEKWWMVTQDEPVGYWPLSLISGFDESPRVTWGGSVCNLEDQGFHTKTQMGSGHFAREGYKRASYVRNALVMDSNKNWVGPNDIENWVSYEGCYRVEECSEFPDDKGTCMFYGGPGGKCCDARCKR